MPTTPTINGADIAAMDFTKSWGLSPGGANIRVPGSVDVDERDSVSIAIGGSTFVGTVTNREEHEGDDGTQTTIEAADNRLLLQDEDLYCVFNKVEVIEDDPATVGIDLKKRYWHILPEDHDAQMKTFTDTPYSVAQILEFARLAPTVVNSWTFTTHLAQAKPVFDVDANNGTKLGTFINDLAERQGLMMTILGASQIIFARRGDGTIPTYPATSFDRRTGSAISNNDTNVRIIGDRSRYQDLPITLEPSWNSLWEEFWLDAYWIQEVGSITAFGTFTDDEAGRAALLAKAKSVTVREYCDAVSETYADHRRWGEVSRMELPAWIYLRDVVFKAYQVPSTYTVNGIPAVEGSLELVEGLLCECDYTTGGSITYGTQLYPQTKAFILVQGQQLGLIDPKYQKALTPTEVAAARTLWQPCSRFNLDLKNKLVIFEEACFMPGAGDNGLFLFPNRAGALALDPADPLYNVVVPNAAVTVTAANVKASLVFEAEKYSKRFGSGTRRGPHYVAGLNYHALMVSGVFTSEVKYIGDKTADDIAADVANGLTLRQSSIPSGGYRRRGSAGTVLNGVIDRVTVKLDADSGMEEQVEMSKQRSPTTFESEDVLNRRERDKDLYPGQRVAREELWTTQANSKLLKELHRTGQPVLRDLNHAMHKPVGSDASTVVTYIEGGPFLAGTPLTSNGAFLGVVTAQNTPGNAHVPLATTGIVPVRVKGPVEIGDVVGRNGSDMFAVVDGEQPIGTVQQDYAGSDTLLVPVRLGGGAAGGNAWHPYQITVAPPATATEEEPNPQPRLIVELDSWVVDGLEMDDKKTVTGLGAAFEFVPGTDDYFYIWIKATISSGAIGTISIEHGDSDTIWETPDSTYPKPIRLDTGADPVVQDRAYLLLGYVRPVTGAEDYANRLTIKRTVGETTTTYQIVQCVRENLILRECCFEGRTVLLFQPYHAPGPA